jgi:hypothetical protein
LPAQHSHRAGQPKGVVIEDERLAYLFDEREANGDLTNFWIFSPAGLKRIVERTGRTLCDYATTGVQKG